MNASTSSSRNTRTSRARTRRRAGHAEEMTNAKNCINHQESTLETTNVTPSHIVDFYQDLKLGRLGVDTIVKFLNKLTLAARPRQKKCFPISIDVIWGDKEFPRWIPVSDRPCHCDLILTQKSPIFEAPVFTTEAWQLPKLLQTNLVYVHGRCMCDHFLK